MAMNQNRISAHHNFVYTNSSYNYLSIIDQGQQTCETYSLGFSLTLKRIHLGTTGETPRVRRLRRYLGHKQGDGFTPDGTDQVYLLRLQDPIFICTLLLFATCCK